MSDACKYCGVEIPEDSCPLRLWNAEGWAAQFYDHCMATWWGIHTLD